MTVDTAVALIVLSGVILASVLGLIGVIVGGRMADRRERNKQAAIEADRHRENTGRLDGMAKTIEHVQSQLPDGGMDTWISTVRTNTEAITRHGEAMSRLADSMDALDQRVIGVEATVAALQAGGTA